MTKEEFLAMSLPTGLKIKDIFYPIRLTGIMDNEYYFGSSLSIEGAENVDKIILHPLSDLTKEIEHKGEKFVPLTRLLEMENYTHFFLKGLGLKNGNDYSLIECWWINTEFDDKPKPYELFSTWQSDRISFEHAVKLISWHFDLADLISKGEAIDVNTLPENPYK